MEEKGGNSFSGDGFFCGAENHPLSKSMVYHNQERIKARRSGEISDEMTGDLLERARRKGFNRRQGRYGGMCVGFVLLACSAVLDITADKRSKAWPPELSGDQLAGFKETRVSGGFVIMAVFQDGTAKSVIGGDVNMAFVGENSGFNLPVSEPRAEG